MFIRGRCRLAAAVRRPVSLAVVIALGGAMTAASVARADLSGEVLSVVAGNGSYRGPSPGGPATRSGLGLPWAVAVDPRGDYLYIADFLNNYVERVTAAGRLSIVAGNGYFRQRPTPGRATKTDLWGPDGLAVDPRTGDLYIADSGHEMVEKVTPSGALSIVAGTGTDGLPTPGPATSSDLNDPGGLAIDPRTGDLYIADSSNNDVERVTPSGTLSIVAGTGTHGPPTPGPAAQSALWSPTGVAVDPRTGDLYIADLGNGYVERVTAAGRLSIVAGTGSPGAPIPGPAVDSPVEPYDVALDPVTGDLYLADSGNDVVEQIAPDGLLSIVAGSGTVGTPTPGPATSSALDSPIAVAVDTTTDDLYIADVSNALIEQVGAGPR